MKHILTPISESEQQLVLPHMMRLREEHAIFCAAEDERILDQFLIAVFDQSLNVLGVGDQQADLERRIAVGTESLVKYWHLFRIYARANASNLSGDELIQMCINVNALAKSAKERKKGRISRPLRQSLRKLGRLRELGFTQEDLNEVLERLPKVAQRRLFARGNPTQKLSSFSEKAAAAHALSLSRQYPAHSPSRGLLVDFAENLLKADCPMSAVKIYNDLPTMAKLAIFVEEAGRPSVPPLFTFEADIDGFEKKIKVVLSGRRHLKGRDASHDLDELALEVIYQHCELQGVERPTWTNDNRGSPGGATHEFLLAVGQEIKLPLVTEHSARRVRSATKRMSRAVRPYFIRLGFAD